MVELSRGSFRLFSLLVNDFSYCLYPQISFASDCRDENTVRVQWLFLYNLIEELNNVCLYLVYHPCRNSIFFHSFFSAVVVSEGGAGGWGRA